MPRDGSSWRWHLVCSSFDLQYNLNWQGLAKKTQRITYPTSQELLLHSSSVWKDMNACKYYRAYNLEILVSNYFLYIKYEIHLQLHSVHRIIENSSVTSHCKTLFVSNIYPEAEQFSKTCAIVQETRLPWMDNIFSLKPRF